VRGSIPPGMTSIYVSVDMEGIGGITTVRQTTRGTDDYAWARLLMTQEANAAAEGAFDGGADVVVVSDSHGDMGNLLPHELDGRIELVQGTPKLPWSMMAGIDAGFAGAVFVGYHAGAGTRDAILDHTYTGWLADVRVNGESWNETHLNAALAGTFDVPVLVVAGDRACCEQAEARLPWVRTVATKQGFGNRAGRSRSPKSVREELRSTVGEAVKLAERAEVWRPSGPYRLEVDVTSTALADILAVAPGTDRVDVRTLRFETDDLRTLYRAVLTWMNLGRRVAPGAAIE
jgi:D-amino peptidase